MGSDPNATTRHIACSRSCALTRTGLGRLGRERTMPDAETEFVDRHRALVQSIVQSVQRQLPIATDTADLEAFGFIGLLEARSRYDAARGAQFTTFAYYRIRGAIIDGIG